MPDKSLSISRGGIVALGEYRELWIFKQITVILKKYKANISTPIEKIPEEALQVILYGSEESVAVPSKKYPGEDWNTKFEGIVNFLKRQQESDNDKIRDWLKDFMIIKTCPDCEGARLKIESRHFRIHDKNISELAEMDVSDLELWFKDIEEKLTDKQNQIAVEILK